MIDSVNNYQTMHKQVGDEHVGPERLAMYQAFKAITGLADPVHPKLVEKGVRGILKEIFGSSPKFGTIQRKLLSSTVDDVGRAVITPNPDYDMDSIGLPEKQAFSVYSKFLVRRLRRRGLPVSESLRHVADRTDLARDMLVQEMESRPVYVNRAPVLHKFGIMAFRPKLVKGNVIQISPLITKGFGADFDGDTMQFHVPTTSEAVQEAYDRMLPSRALISPSDYKTPIHVPGQEYLAGLYSASTHKGKDRPHVFRNAQDAIAAWRRGLISVGTPVEIME
jgi:DNA-directed RNA polymerase beta' subunit